MSMILSPIYELGVCIQELVTNVIRRFGLLITPQHFA